MFPDGCVRYLMAVVEVFRNIFLFRSKAVIFVGINSC